MKKYEREIRELLEKMDAFVPDSPTPEKERIREREPEREREPRRPVISVMPTQQPIPIRPRRTAVQRLMKWFTDHQVNKGLQIMLAGLVLVILALIIRQNIPDAKWVAQIIGAIGGIIFAGPVILRFLRGKDLDDGPKMWRGQQTETEDFSWSGLRRWFGKGSDKKNINISKDRNNRR